MGILKIVAVLALLVSITCDILSRRNINIVELVVWKIIAMMYLVQV